MINQTVPWPFPIDKFKTPTAFKRYGFAVLVNALAFALTYWLRPLVRSNLFDLFQGAVVLCALYAGLGPALLTAALSIVTLDYFFIPPLNTLTVGLSDFIRLLIFAAVAVVTSSLSARLKQAKSDLQSAHDDLEVRIAQRTDELSKANLRLISEVDQRLQAEKAILEISSREQQRLGQDLHDGLCQILAGVRLLSEELTHSLAAKARSETELSNKIVLRLTEALAQADSVSRGLYPVELETHGLMAALQELADKTQELYSVNCQFYCLHPVLIHNSSTATHLFRIAQEAVINAIKGGKAKSIRIRLAQRRSYFILSVFDNGSGLQSPPSRQGMGLKIMNYRARVINAQLQLKSRSRGGTQLSCRFASDLSGENDGS